MGTALAAKEVQRPDGQGQVVTLESLRQDFDAIFLGLGLGEGISLGEGEGVFGALEFLRRAKGGQLKKAPKRVAVLGAGNTAMDAALTALRLGARDCMIVYRRSFAEMPAWPKEREALLAAGGHILILSRPIGFAFDAQGRLKGIRIVRTQLGEPDRSGRRKPEDVPGSEYLLEADWAIQALGQALPDELRKALQPLTFDSRGYLAVQAGTGFTGLEGVYAGGDIVNGGTTAVQGIFEGMRAAKAISEALGAPVP
jgi:NADPH-dependent glutamate synthase beta subunit-like oxidoreductase